MCSEDSSVALLGLGQSGPLSSRDTNSFEQVLEVKASKSHNFIRSHTAQLEIKLKNQFKRRASYVHGLGQIADINS